MHISHLRLYRTKQKNPSPTEHQPEHQPKYTQNKKNNKKRQKKKKKAHQYKNTGCTAIEVSQSGFYTNRRTPEM